MKSLSSSLQGSLNKTCLKPAKRLTQRMKTLLWYWYQKRVVENKTTTALMESIDNPHDRKVLGIVALLDVDSMVMKGLMDFEEFQFVKVCHSYLRARDCVENAGETR